MTARVLVTGVGGRSVGAGILHALMRTDPAVRSRWHTVGVDADPFSWGLYVADHAALVPPATDERYLDRLRELVEDHDIAAILPGSEPEAVLLAGASAQLPVPVIANRAELMPLMADKQRAEAKLRELGLNFIPSYPWERREEAIERFSFPLFVKPTVGTGGSRGVHLVTSRAELDGLSPFVSPQSRSIIQPYLGDGESEYTVGVLSDQRGRVVDSIVIRRKLIGLSLLDAKSYGDHKATVSTGISQGFVVRRPEIQAYCESLAELLDSRGPLNLQLRIHEGEMYVFEIHPRFSGTTPIRASVGFNEPDLLLRNVLYDEPLGRVSYREDMAAIRAYEHVLVPVSDMHSPP